MSVLGLGGFAPGFWTAGWCEPIAGGVWCDSYYGHLGAGLGGCLEQKTLILLRFFNVFTQTPLAFIYLT